MEWWEKMERERLQRIAERDRRIAEEKRKRDAETKRLETQMRMESQRYYAKLQQNRRKAVQMQFGEWPARNPLAWMTVSKTPTPRRIVVY